MFFARASLPSFALLAFTLAACGQDFASPAKARIVSKRIEGGELALSKGESAALGVAAFDDAGREISVDPSCVSWKSGDRKSLPVEPLLPSAAVVAKSAWFDFKPVPAPDQDAGPADEDGGAVVMTAPMRHEPAATIALDACGAKAAIVARSVISIAGTWQITVGQHLVQLVKLTQEGRRVSYVPTDGVAQPAGEVHGDHIAFSLMGFDLDGTLASPTEASGMVAGVDGTDGGWTAVKITSPTL